MRNRFQKESIRISWFASAILLICAVSAWANDLSVTHDLNVELITAEKKLVGYDQMKINPGGHDTLTFRLSEKVARIDLTVNGRPRSFTRRQGIFQAALKPEEQGRTITAAIRYSAIFDDPLPIRPVNLDNPGFGVGGTISDQGTFLSSGSYWHPQLDDSRPTYRITVRAPAGTIAVTAGRSLGYVTRQGKTESVWRVDYPVEGLSLSAARYVVREKKAGAITAATYFLSSDRQLSDAYLAATGRYLSWYADLFGPYPFDKFAVVENFFPTGFGYPSYTLLGSRVLRLPFIIHTSLGHEIAHCWWGNGVLVDYENGNWSEALTTYVSDYLPLEQKSESAAKNYRRQILRNYATLVKPQSDFALSRFVGRSDPVTKTIGYDKGAMVFHMLRKLLGEDAFWGALRDLYNRRLFKKTAWKDLQRNFENRAQRSLANFFDQWVYRKGAPRFYLGEVKTDHTDEQWIIRGRIVQQKPYYAFPLALMLENGGKPIAQKIDIAAEHSTPFQLVSQTPPQKLTLDPDVDLMRQLLEEEIPPSINSLKSSPGVIFLIADDAGPEIRQVAKILALSLSLKKFEFVSASRISQAQLIAHDLIMFGSPQKKELLRRLPEQVQIHPKTFRLNGRLYGGESAVFFGVFEHPYADKRVAALFWPPTSRYAERVVRKITHYGKYSYLAFEEGTNRARGFWQTNESPLVHRWGDN